MTQRMQRIFSYPFVGTLLSGVIFLLIPWTIYDIIEPTLADGEYYKFLITGFFCITVVYFILRKFFGIREEQSFGPLICYILVVVQTLGMLFRRLV